MSFKNLNDSQRKRALVPFLSAADEIHGVSISIVFDKRIQHLFASKQFIEDDRFARAFQGKWNPRSLESVLRIVHFIALFLGAFSQENQNIYWISDNDDFFATAERSRDTARLLSSFTSLYVSHKLGELGVGTTNLDEGDRLEEDLAAIPDLIAGSLAETMTSLLKRYGKIPQVPVVLERHTTKAELISNWLFFSKRRLKKVTCLFEHVPPKQFRAGVFWLDGLDL